MNKKWLQEFDYYKHLNINVCTFFSILKRYICTKVLVQQNLVICWRQYVELCELYSLEYNVSAMSAVPDLFFQTRSQNLDQALSRYNDAGSGFLCFINEFTQVCIIEQNYCNSEALFKSMAFSYFLLCCRRSDHGIGFISPRWGVQTFCNGS